MRGMSKGIAILAVSCMALVACVGQKQFTIMTTPSGATVSINGQPVEGKTPITIEISQDKDLGIVVEKPGYSVGSVTINTQTSWWRALLWTENDPKARYIEEDSVTIPLKPNSTDSTYTPTNMGTFSFPDDEDSKVPALRPMPEF